jgi:tetratricopeptide (TPR) repeat protein
MGASPSMKKVDFDREGVNPAVSPLFLINDATREILPLYAFFDVDEAIETGLPELGKDVFVFEGNTKSTVIYLSSNGEHLEKSSRFQHWKDLLAQKQLEVEWADTKNLNLNTLRAIGKHISAVGIQALIASAKYLRDATIPRQDLNELLDSFSFSDFNGFVLGGESGIGKSTLLAQKSEEWHTAGHMVTFYRGSAFNQSDVANKFLRDCALKVHYLEDFLSVLHPIFSSIDKKCYLIVDALNEYAGDLNDLIKSIEGIVAQAAHYSWFKVIVSIRDSAYNRAQARFGELNPQGYFLVEEEKAGEKVRTNIVRLQPISMDFVEQLYNAYRNYKWKDIADTQDDGYYTFRPLTEFSDLDKEGSTVQLIRSPLMARLVMQSFHRAKLPAQLTNDDAMRLYHDNIVIEKNADSLGFPERKKLLNMLVMEFDKQSTERLERDDLMKNSAIRPYLINNQRDSAYIQLLDLGVLMEEWESEDCFVRFAFDKFFEFLLAELHWPRTDDAISLMDLSKRAVSYKILQGAVEIILVRFCSNNQSHHLVDLIDLADEESEEVKILVKDTAVRILVVLCNEYPKLFEDVINEFPKRPGELDLQILKELLDKLFLTGQLEGFEKAMEVATQEAELLDNQKVLSDFLISNSLFLSLRGRVEECMSLLTKASVIKQFINDEIGLANCLRLIGVRWYSLGNYEAALHNYQMSFDLACKQSDKLSMSRCLNNIANIHWTKGEINQAELNFKQSLAMKLEIFDRNGEAVIYGNLGLLYKHQGKIEESEKLHSEALEIRRQLGDKQGISASLTSLGNIYKDQGKLEEAEKLHLESLEINRHLGNKKAISISLANLGNIYKDQGKTEEAEKLHLESLEIKRQLGDKKGIGASLSNLGNIYKDQGKIEESEKLQLESLEIYKQLGNKQGISASLTSLGNIYKDRGMLQEAENLHLESLEIKRQLGDKKGISASLTNLGNIYKDQGKLEESEKLFKESLEIKRLIRDNIGICKLLEKLGGLNETLGNVQVAESCYLESLEVRRQLGYLTEISLAILNLGVFYQGIGKVEEAEKCFRESLEIDRKFEDKKGLGITLNNLGVLCKEQGRIAEARQCYEESLQIRRDIEDGMGVSESLNNLALLYLDEGELDKAEENLLESLEIRRGNGDNSGVSDSLANLGIVYREQGRRVDADRLYAESIEIKQMLGDRKGIAAGMISLGNLSKDQGKIEEAEKLYLESLSIFREIDDKKGIGIALHNLGATYLFQGNETAALECFREAVLIKRALKEKVTLLSTIHIGFSLFEESEREVFMQELTEMNKQDFTPLANSWYMNVELIYTCLNKPESDVQDLEEKCNRINECTLQINIQDLDESPVEAYYQACKRFISLGRFELAKQIASLALAQIKDCDAKRKSELYGFYEKK